ncbi:hypothetical protein [Nesterenkonia sp.]|uniref:hypothetical protein n=1 Tax=Nesterenkonia sp. TaxID=704201 RepID=UPI00260EAAFD|nr:hypothetical protein [Nesterenkonia sp.]
MAGVLGVDWSLTATGLAWLNLDDGAVDTCTIRTWPDDGTVEGIARRITHIADRIEAWADLHADDLVVIEGPVTHAPSAHRSKMLGGWWAVAARLAPLVDDPVMVVPPKTRAKYATGRGGADKSEVLAAVRANYPRFSIADDNQADAVVLAAIGARSLGHPIDDLPASHLAALTKRGK